MNVSRHGVEFTAHFENVYQSVYCPYWDAYGRVYTRGYGETDWGGNFGGRCISHATALENLERNLNGEYGQAVRNLGVPLTQNQFDALTDFSYNLGPGSMEWNIGRELRARNYEAAANDMLQYRFAGGVELSGLRERRYAERDLFLTPDGNAKPKPRPPANPADVLLPDERKVYEAYRTHHKQSDKRTLVFMRKNIYEAATHGRLYTNKKKHVAKGWNINNRYARYQFLKQVTK